MAIAADKQSTTDDLSGVDLDFVSFAEIATSQSPDGMRLLLAKLVRKYRMSHPLLAERLSGALRASQTRGSPPSVLRRGGAPLPHTAEAMPVDSESRSSLVRVFDDLDGLDAPLLVPQLQRGIEAIVNERQQRARLEAHGIRPTRSAILIGPPGVGKTLSARWIASRLGKPLWVLDLTTVMSSLLGKTSSNLRAVFDHAKANEAVLLLDEVDSIAKRRSDETDVGELKRLVTSILQEVDAWPASGLLLAATNHPELIDPALWRRFDHILRFDGAAEGLTEAAVRRFLGASQAEFEAVTPMLGMALQGMSMSDVERAITSLRRDALLGQGDPVDLATSLAAEYAHRLDKKQRQELAIRLASAGLPHDTIRALTGVSRDTIRKYAGPSAVRGRPRKDA